MATNTVAWTLSARDETREAFESVKKRLSDVGGKFNALAAVAGVAFGAKEIVDSLVSYDKLKASLVTVTGSVDQASVAFASLKTFATETPFTVEQVTQSFIKLKALGLDPTEKNMRAFGNVAAGMGKNLDQFVEAVADAVTGQLGGLKEFGIKSQQAGDQIEFTFRGVSTKVGKSAADIQDYLSKIGEIQFADAMARQADTLGGAFTRVGNSFGDLAEAIGKTGVYRALVNTAEGMTSLTRSATEFIDYLSGDSVRKAGDAFEKNIAPNKTLLNSFSSSIYLLRNGIEGIDKTNLDQVNAVIKEMAKNGIDLAQNAPLGDLQNKIADASKAWGDLERNKSAVEKFNPQAIDQFTAAIDKAKARVVDLVGQYAELSKPKDVGAKAAVDPAIQRFIDSLKTDSQIVDDFAAKMAILNERFNVTSGGTSPALYSAQIAGIAGELKNVGEASEAVKPPKFLTDTQVVKAFTDEMEKLNAAFNANKINPDRYTDAIKSISGEVQKLGQVTADVEPPKFLTDVQVLEKFDDDLLVLTRQFLTGATNAERYSDAVKGISGEVQKLGQVSKDSIRIVGDKELVQDATDQIDALMNAFNRGPDNGGIGADTFTDQMATVAGKLKAFGHDNEKEAGKYSAVWAHAGERMADGIGDAVADAFQHEKNFMDSVQAVSRAAVNQVISGLVSIGVQTLILDNIQTGLSTKRTARTVAEAAATTASWTPAAVVTSIGSFGSNVWVALAALAAGWIAGKAILGQAHDGHENIPRTGTYMIEQGERVVKKEDNKKLTKMLDRQNSSRSQSINFNYTINAGGGASAAQVRALIPMIESVSIASVNRALRSKGRSSI